MPPVIPTSFVPHPSGASAARGRSSFGFASILSALAYLFFVLAIVSAAGVFIYNRILISEKASKDAELATAEASLNQATIEQFLQLRDRFSSAKTLLNNHIALSGLFDLLASVSPANVRFSSLSVVIDDTGKASLQASGSAKSFNTLAVASDDFNADARLKNAIFSNLAIAAGGSVHFLLSATLDPALITYTGSAATIAAPLPSSSFPSASSTTTTTTTAPATGSSTSPQAKTP